MRSLSCSTEEEATVSVDGLPWSSLLEMEPDPAEKDSCCCRCTTRSTTRSTTTPTSPTIHIPCAAKQSATRRQRRRPLRITFGTVHVVHFWPCLGDHPYVSSGCPIALGDPIPADPTTTTMMDMDSYEQFRPSQQRRSPQQLRIPADERFDMLLTMGLSEREILERMKDNHISRGSMRRSARHTTLDACYRAMLGQIGDGERNHVGSPTQKMQTI